MKRWVGGTKTKKKTNRSKMVREKGRRERVTQNTNTNNNTHSLTHGTIKYRN